MDCAELTKLYHQLRERLDSIERKPKPIEIEAPTPVDGIKRDAKGRVVVNPDVPPYDKRMAERRAATKAAEEAERQERAANGGRFQDPFGIWREKDGAMSAVRQRESAHRAFIEARMAVEQNDDE